MNTPSAIDNSTLNNGRSVWVAVFFLSVAYLIYNTLPVVLGAAADGMGLNDVQIGYLGSSYMFGAVAVGISSIFWVRRVNWRWVVAISSLTVLACYAIASFVSYDTLKLAFFGVGFANGAIVSCVLTYFGDTDTPDRNFGYGVGTQVLLAGLAAYFMPIFITPQWGFGGIMLLFGAMVAITLLLVPFFPARGCRGYDKPSQQASTHSPVLTGSLLGVVLGVAGMFIYFLGETGVWAFLDRVGLANGLSYAAMGEAFGISLIISSAGAYLASFMGDRYGRIIPIMAATIALIAGLLLMLYAHSAFNFGLGMLLFAGAWNFVLPFQMSLISEGDTSGRLTPLIPTCQLLGSAIGPAIAGHMVIDGSYFYVYAFAFAAAIISTILCVWAEVFVYRPMRLAAQPLVS
ncbi:MFS transporter [Dasania marina]|uniref:MFS transporter n=1 Tax=Dasania marina TaxID=471499 RepID=UPI00037F9A81|nr:MFS transporter [Dasania marina]